LTANLLLVWEIKVLIDISLMLSRFLQIAGLWRLHGRHAYCHIL